MLGLRFWLALGLTMLGDSTWPPFDGLREVGGEDETGGGGKVVGREVFWEGAEGLESPEDLVLEPSTRF